MRTEPFTEIRGHRSKGRDVLVSVREFSVRLLGKEFLSHTTRRKRSVLTGFRSAATATAEFDFGCLRRFQKPERRRARIERSAVELVEQQTIEVRSKFHMTYIV